VFEAAHGHLIVATGVVLTTRLLYSMRLDRINKRIVTLCTGGVLAIALAIESVK